MGLLALVVVGQYFLLMSGSALFSGDLGVVLWLLGLAALPVTLGVGLWRAVVALSGEESAPRLVLFHRGLAGVWGAAFTLAALFSVS